MKEAQAIDFVKEGISLDNGAINEERVLTLMGQVTSVIPSLEPGKRMVLFPYMILGTKTPPLYGSEQIQHPKKVQLCLTGLVNVMHYGLDSYMRPCRPENHNSQLMGMSGKHRVMILLKYVDAGLFKSMGTVVERFQINKIPRAWSDPMAFMPHFKPDPALHRGMPPVPTKLVFPHGWDLSLEDFAPSHILDLFIEKYRYQYDRVERDGFAGALGDAKFTIDRNLMWMPEGMKRMAPDELEKPPRKVIRAPDASRSPSPLPLDYDVEQYVASPEPGPEPTPDHPEYEDMVQTWSAVPDGAHWSWKATLEEVKTLAEVNRSETILRGLVTKASEAEKDDWKMLRQKVRDIFEHGQEVSEDDMNTNIPLAFGRQLGLHHPEGPVANAWRNHFMR